MLYSRLSERMKTPISPDKFNIIENYINSLSYSATITAAKASKKLSFDNSLINDILQALVDIEVLHRSLALRCPECGFLVETVDTDSDINGSIYCHCCDNDVDVDYTDVEETFCVLRTSNEVAEKFPDSYSLLTVDKKCAYGVSQGRVLHYADSIEELNNFAEANNIDDSLLLHYVTGDNLL